MPVVPIVTMRLRAPSWSRVAFGVAWAAVLLLVMLAVPAVASADDGFEGPDGATAGASPSGSKPESKVWYNDGIWWASLWDAGTADFYIWRLDGGTNAWTRTATRLDDRPSTRADVLWDGTKLYVASHTFSESDGTGTSRLYRFSYNAATDIYSLDAGFPATINAVRSETLVIAKDSTGQLWATWEQGNRIWVTHTTTSDSAWATPFIVPSSATVASDDISSIIAFGGNKIGIFWSDQSENPDADFFAIHNDADPDGTWQAPEIAYQTGASVADDHIDLKTTADGRVFSVVKTSLTGSSPIIVLLARTTGGSWSAHTVSTAATGQTRPIVVIDETSSLLRVFYSSQESGGSINTKTSPISAISFAGGAGTIVMNDTSAPKINNVTSSKQNVTAATGLVILAFNETTKRYWHTPVLPGGGPVNSPPTANATSANTPASTAVAVALSGSDTATCQLTFSIVTPPAHGTLGAITGAACVAGTPNADSASVTYTPTAGYTGPDAFSYRVNDGSLDSSAATASLMVGGDATAPVRGATTVTGATLTVSYNEPLDLTSVPASTAFAIQVAGSPRSVSGVGISGSTVSLTLASPVSAGQAVTLGYVIPGVGPVQDSAGNDAPAYSGAAVTNNTQPPGSETTLTFAAADDAQVKSSSPNSNYGADASLRLRSEPAPAVTYNSFLRFDVSGVTGPVTAVKLRLFVTDVSPDSGTVFSTSNSWSESTLTWNTAPTFGTTALGGAGATTVVGSWVDIPLTATAVAGNGSVSFAMRNASTNSAIFSSREGTNPPQLLVTFGTALADGTAPVRQSAGIETTTVTLTYDESLDGASTPEGTAFAVTAGTDPLNVTNVAVSGSAVTLTVSPAATSSDVVEVDYLPAAAPIQDLAGNDAAGFTDVAVTNTTPPPLDTAAPVRLSTGIDAATLTLTYDEPLDGASTPAGVDFAVTAGVDPLTVTNVVVSGTTVTLTVSPAVTSTDGVEVDYVPGAAPIQDPIGNDAAGFTDVSATNTTLPPPPPDTTAPVRQSATVDAATLTLTYDEALDTTSTPAMTDIVVTAGVDPLTVTNIVVSGATVTLTISPAVTSSDAVGIDYAPGAAPIQDLAGNDATGFAGVAATNTTPPPPPPDTTAPVRGATAVNGASLTIAYDEPLDGASVPAAEDFAVNVGGSGRSLIAVSVGGSTVTLTLVTPVRAGENVALDYTVPATGPIQDPAGNDADGFSAAAVTNQTAASSTTTTFIATADAHAKSTSPTSNYGTLSTLQLRQDPGTLPTYHDYLEFQVSGLGGPATAVTLRLFVTDISDDSGRVVSSATGWTETGITWNNAPPPDTTVLGAAGASTTVGAWIDIALSPSAVAADGTYSFVLLTDSANSTIFSSRQGTNPPQLVVTYPP